MIVAWQPPLELTLSPCRSQLLAGDCGYSPDPSEEHFKTHNVKRTQTLRNVAEVAPRKT